MRWFRKITSVCQNCQNGNNEKGKWIKTWKRKPIDERGFWHIYCDKKGKYYAWDSFKRCYVEYKIDKMRKLNLLLDGKKYILFVLNDTDTQGSCDLIRDYIAFNIDDILKNDNVRIIQPRNKFIAQLPNKLKIDFSKEKEEMLSEPKEAGK